MKASDYIVEYLIKRGITDVFGYPGGMVIHLMDSFSKYKDQITAHISYNEQGASMAACGYAQTSGKTGVAYATSGPGATNLITGICNAYMDSIPTLFITGQVNSYEQKGDLNIRQRGFQETDIVSMVSSVTKYASKVNSAEKLKLELDKAFYIANSGRKGPVLLDVAMDVSRTDINQDKLEGFVPKENVRRRLSADDIEIIKSKIHESSRPVFLLGNGIHRDCRTRIDWKKILNKIGVPSVSSMISVDLKSQLDNYYGFIGAYGDRTANFVVAKSDLVITIGARLDVRQVGAIRSNFAPDASIIRIDIDAGELEYKVHDNEISFCVDALEAIYEILELFEKLQSSTESWKNVCNKIQQKLSNYDLKEYNSFVKKISQYAVEKSVITTDVGQNQVWIAQSFDIKYGQRILFSGGHGAMGYSLPAAIGASIASGDIVYSFNGDGGIQMNIQELQMISEEHLPVKIIVFNNNSLGMIRHFQEMYMACNYFQTTRSGGFSSPNFAKIAEAYNIGYINVKKLKDIDDNVKELKNLEPVIIEIELNTDTYVFPKLEYGKPNQDQEPLLDRVLYEQLMRL